MSRLAIDYFILATLVCAGFLQGVAAYSRLYGLLLIRNVRAGYAVGAILAGVGFAWFTLEGNMAIPGDRGGIEGSQQFRLFLAGAAAATVLTSVAASFAQIKRRGKPAADEGMEAFRDATLLQALQCRLHRGKPAGRPVVSAHRRAGRSQR